MTVAEHLSRVLIHASDLAEERPQQTSKENLMEIREALHKLNFAHEEIEEAIRLFENYVP